MWISAYRLWNTTQSYLAQVIEHPLTIRSQMRLPTTLQDCRRIAQTTKRHLLGQGWFCYRTSVSPERKYSSFPWTTFQIIWKFGLHSSGFQQYPTDFYIFSTYFGANEEARGMADRLGTMHKIATQHTTRDQQAKLVKHWCGSSGAS
jgi:hypothetical protein